MYEQRYEEAKLIYKKYGVDTDKVLDKISEIHLSIQCWQGDDVKGFEKSDSISGEEFKLLEITLEEQEILQN